MSECVFQSRLAQYHDGELDAAAAAEVETHLSTCQACSAQLQEHRALSQALAGVEYKPITVFELRRLHLGVDEATDRSIFRFTAGLSAIAASILIIGMAWLYDSPAMNPGSVSAPSVAATQEVWENLAMGSQPEMNDARQTDFSKTRQASHWMETALSRK